MAQLEKLPNIGKVGARRLEEVGIDHYEKLKAIGSKKALLMLREKDPGACLHELMALEGAIQGIRKYDLPDEVKQDLKDWFRTL